MKLLSFLSTLSTKSLLLKSLEIRAKRNYNISSKFSELIKLLGTPFTLQKIVSRSSIGVSKNWQLFFLIFLYYEVWNSIGIKLFTNILLLGTKYNCCKKDIGPRSKSHCLFFLLGTETYPNIPEDTWIYPNIFQNTK